MMMPDPEYQRVSALTNAEWDREYPDMCASTSGLAQEYHAIKGRIRAAAIEGRGPGAWFERFLHECAAANGRASSDRGGSGERRKAGSTANGESRRKRG